MTYRVGNARYAKGKKIIFCPSNDDFMTRAGRLAEALKGRWTNRERGYIVSVTKAVKFEKLYNEGYDGSSFTKELIKPLDR